MISKTSGRTHSLYYKYELDKLGGNKAGNAANGEWRNLVSNDGILVQKSCSYYIIFFWWRNVAQRTGFGLGVRLNDGQLCI